MVNLQSVKKAPHARPIATSSRGGDGSGTRGVPERGVPEGASGSPTASRPAKKLKTAVRKVSVRSVARERDSVGPSRAVPSGEGPTVVDLSGVAHERDFPRYSEGEEYRATSMTSLPAGVPGAPYAARWPDLKADSRIWADGATAQEFVRGALHPALAKELYGSTSEVLADRATKSLVWGQHYVMALIDRVLDTGWVIEHQSNTNIALRLENQELRNSSGPEVVAAVEQRAAALDEEVSRLKAELEESQAHARTLDDELRTVSNDIESTRSSAWAAEEALKEEQRVLPERIERAVVEYKASAGFERGLVRSGRATYEFGYRVACARVRASHPKPRNASGNRTEGPAASSGGDNPGSLNKRQ
ncbi:hypothetical protein C4D60_Mb03t00980 [Musa balbisiana]|uniref:Uncharacterized protein n=1 Tax=Musa balbisiana TaxID=52838 RepID=A0A4S8J7P0_MUSBA|nr:hypothetical protein C4D60_Mb03t00980 [Musa balbisiana]